MSIVDHILSLPAPVLSHWGYWIVMLFAMAEAVPLVGLLAPGMLIVIIGGFFAKIGILHVGYVIVAASIGAIIGDLIGYTLGKKYGYSLLTKYGKYFFFKEKYIEKTKTIMQDHTGKTLIIGRFNSLTRAFAPFVAGTSDTPLLKFLTYNVIGGISWAISFVMVGYIFGASYEVAAQYIGKFIFIAIVLSIVIVYTYKFIDKRKHIFSKYHLYTLILNIFSLYIFSKMIEDVVDGELITRLDIWLNAHMVSFWNPILNNVMVFITSIANPLSMFVLSLALFWFLAYRKKWYYALLLIFSLSGGLLLEVLIKIVVHRARPENSLIEVTGYSFPSGHATIAIIFFSIVLYAFKDDIKHVSLRYTFIVGNILLFLLVGFSRVYLNVHWCSDVIAGFGLGLFWLTLLVLVFQIIISLSKNTLRTLKSILQKYIPTIFT